jgi:hypothetical protein
LLALSCKDSLAISNTHVKDGKRGAWPAYPPNQYARAYFRFRNGDTETAATVS